MKDLSLKKSIAKTVVGKKDKATYKYKGQKDIYNEVETGIMDEKEVYLWGKNYYPNSKIKFEYYLDSVKKSYPDFIMKDAFGRVHLFEVKSINEKQNTIGFDKKMYEKKISELRKAYCQASKLTNQYFYIPLLKGLDS